MSRFSSSFLWTSLSIITKVFRMVRIEFCLHWSYWIIIFSILLNIIFCPVIVSIAIYQILTFWKWFKRRNHHSTREWDDKIETCCWGQVDEDLECNSHTNDYVYFSHSSCDTIWIIFLSYVGVFILYSIYNITCLNSTKNKYNWACINLLNRRTHTKQKSYVWLILSLNLFSFVN